MATTDGWSEYALVSLAAQGGSEIAFQSITSSIDIDMGDKDIESMAMLNGARMVKFLPQGDTTVTMEMYPEEAGVGDISAATSGTGIFDLFHVDVANTYAGEDTIQPYAISAAKARSQFRLCILWTNKTSASSATEEIATPFQAKRFTAADGYITSAKPSFTDGLLKWTVKFKVPPLDSAASANIKIESLVGGSTNLDSLNSYTESTKF